MIHHASEDGPIWRRVEDWWKTAHVYWAEAANKNYDSTVIGNPRQDLNANLL
jgi:hypothetical protein